MTALKQLPISVCIIAGNEALRIRRALESVAGWTAEIIVVINDDVSDGTDKIATEFGAKVFREPWKGHIAQKNSAAQKAGSDWILGLDADEAVSPELRDEVQKLFSGPQELQPFVAFSFPRLCWYCGRWIRHGDWYPDRQIRLWRRGAAEWGGVDPHDKLIVQGRVGRLRSDLRHFSNESINRHLQKIIPFSDEFVRQRVATGQKAGVFDLAIRPVWRFLRAYFFRRGFLDGWPGYYIAWLNAFSTVTRYSKLREVDLNRASPAMKVSLIISTYNQPDALAKVLQGATRQTRCPNEILIADDGSAEATRRLVDQWRPQARCPVRHLWHADEGFRKTAILNKAVQAATGDYLIFLDGDCVPHPRFVEDHVRLAEPGFWVQGRRCFVKEKFVPEFTPGETPVWRWLLTARISGVFKSVRLPFPLVCRDKKQRGIIGCNMAFWRDDIVAVNGFDEEYAGWGIGEDSDLGTRLYHLGRLRKFVYAHAIIYHLNHPLPPRDHFPSNQARLQETIRLKKIRCERGLNQHR